jgi:microcystin-dependent protein/cytoskeletal protein CcmA (bactofilin family)
MPYNINYTDRENKTPVTVFDNTSNTDTSLTFPGRNVTGYGQLIGENFLALLENFASPTQPVNPTEGQIWYNSDPAVSSLLVWDGSDWKSASGVQKSPTEPGVEQAKVGELWVDTVNQQLYVFSGTNWILVGPNFSTGLKTGLQVERVIDSDDIERVVSILYVEDRPIVIISKDSFTPKDLIPQFPNIRSGITVAGPNVNIDAETEVYIGGLLPKLYGTATSADGLNVTNRIIESSKFLRSDIVNVVENAFNVKSDSGITFGIDGIFNISTSVTATRLYNNSPGSAIDFQLSRSGLATTVLRIFDGNIGINNLAPTEPLDVTGNTKISGILRITNNTNSTINNVNTGAVQIVGGASIAQDVFIQGRLTVNNTTEAANIIPNANEVHDLGSSQFRWREIRTKTLFADSIVGTISGSISGNAGTATALQQQTTFSMTGDITAPSFSFNGAVGGTTKSFVTSISPSFISNARAISTLSLVEKPYSLRDDVVLVNRSTQSQLLKATRDEFVGDLGLPIGAILPYAGPNVPFGFLLCDGSEILISQYPALYQIIDKIYNGVIPLRGTDTYRLPDLRGRFPLGKDNMDNGFQIAVGNANQDAGGGNADRVDGVEADTLGAAAGNSQPLLNVSNLPNHEHDMRGSAGQRYFAVRADTSVPLDSGAFLGVGGTTANRLQYLPNSGGIRADVTGQPYAVMNPFLTINYIIRAGAPEF